MHFRGIVRQGRTLGVGAMLWLLAWTGATVAQAAQPKWQVVRGDFFDLYSTASASEAIDTAVWLEQFRRTVAELWKIDTKRLRRAAVVQFGTDKEFNAYRQTKHIAGYMVRTDLAVVMALGSETEAEGARQIVQHECTHWMVGSLGTQFPVWFNEGFAELYSTFRIEGSKCHLFEPDASNVLWLRSNGLNSLSGVLATTHSGIDYSGRDTARSFYAQSWLMVHYLLRGRDLEQGAQKLSRFMTLRESGQPQDEAFQAAFGFGYDAMQKRLQRYLQSGSYTKASAPFARDELRKKFHPVPAPAVEIECALAALSLHAKRDVSGAVTRLRAARERWPDSPLPAEGLGSVAEIHGDLREAARHFKDAAARGSVHPLAFFRPAALDLHDRLNGPPELMAMPATEAAQVAEDLKRALEIEPGLAFAADDLSLALLFKEPLVAADLNGLMRYVRHAPEPEAVRYRVAGLLHRFGDRANARRILENIAANATRADVRAAAEADLRLVDEAQPGVRLGLFCVIGAGHVKYLTAPISVD